MEVTELERATYIRLAQKENVKLPIEVTRSGIVTDARLVQK
jgi:hypothetical protein